MSTGILIASVASRSIKAATYPLLPPRIL
jgi:hypothetical protein